MNSVTNRYAIYRWSHESLLHTPMASPVPTSYLGYQNGTWGPDSGLHPERYIRIPKMGIRSEHTRSTYATLPRLNLGSHQALPQFRGVLQYTYPDSGWVNKTSPPFSIQKHLQACKCSFWILHVYIGFSWPVYPLMLGFAKLYILPYVKFCKVLYSPTLTFINTLYTENPGRSHHDRTSSPLHPSPAAGCTIVAVHL